jgi:hypothetical protein
MPGLIQCNNGDDSSDDESEEDGEMSVPVVLEEYTIGGEDQVARLPGEPMEPPRGQAREEYMNQRRELWEFVGVYSLYWMDRAWDIVFQQYRRSELQKQRDLLVQMAIANAERRNTSNSNFANFGQTEWLLLDSASTIHTARNKRGMTNLRRCNKAVNSAD